MNSSAVAKRSACSFASAFMITASSAGLIAGLIELGSGAGSLTCLRAIVTALSPSNGTWPVTIS
uniref:Unannotated protein n=1 Tax=freshwater metagenome TaxID=449393 RepID=A0A6J5ZPV4_9ZZZZ